MFRALLWKEWRELWMLPALAAPLAAIGFFLMRSELRYFDHHLSAWAFTIGFSPSLIFLPVGLFGKDREEVSSQFLQARPLDRFRLWWINLAIGATILLAAGVLSYLTTVAMTHYVAGFGLYEALGRIVPWTFVRVMALIYCLSYFGASLPRRSKSLVVGASCLSVIIMYVGLYAAIASKTGRALMHSFSDNQSNSTALCLLLSFLFLFASLAVYSGTDVRKQTRGFIARMYGISAMTLLLPACMAAFYLVSRNAFAVPPQIEEMEMVIGDLSADKQRIVLLVKPKEPRSDADELLIGLDIGKRRMHIIERGEIFPPTVLDAEGANVVYASWTQHLLLLSEALFLSDFEGTRKTNLLRDAGVSASFRESNDGRYIGLTTAVYGRSARGGFVAIADFAGRIIVKHEFPPLEGAQAFPLGWDYESRFYFNKTSEKRNFGTTVWRIAPDNPVPEEVVSLRPESIRATNISPDGRWISCRKEDDQGKTHEWRLYNIETEESHPVSGEILDFTWADDGRRVVLQEDDPENPKGRARLVIYEPQTRRSSPIRIANDPLIQPHAWAPSGDRLLVSYSEEFDEAGKAIPEKDRVRKLVIYSAESGRFTQVQPPTEDWSRHIRYHSWQTMWASDSQLLWTFDNLLISTKADGTDAKQIFRVEDGKFYLYGEEQT